jgi:ABC-type glycerol-3-phosphate transport system permease component
MRRIFIARPSLWGYSLLGLTALTALLPLWVMLILATSTNAELAQHHGVVLWPKGFTLEPFIQIFKEPTLLRASFNSFAVAIVASVGHVLTSAMCGYALVHLDLPKRSWLTLGVLITLLLPPQVNIVPLFLLMKQLGLLNNYGALILPALISGFGVFLFRQWFLSFPTALKEAATLEGCTPWQTFWYVALPSATSPMISLGLLTFISLWGSFLWPLVAIHDASFITLPLYLAQLKQQYRDVVDWPILMACASVMILPVVGLFLLLQKQFFKQMGQGDGLKG